MAIIMNDAENISFEDFKNLSIDEKEDVVSNLRNILDKKNDEYFESLNEDTTGLGIKTRSLSDSIQSLYSKIGKFTSNLNEHKKELDDEPTERLDNVIEKVNEVLESQEVVQPVYESNELDKLKDEREMLRDKFDDSFKEYEHGNRELEKELEEKEAKIKELEEDEDIEVLEEDEDSKTIELPKTKLEKIDNIKIVFDLSNCVYKIIYEKNNENITDLVTINSGFLNYDDTNIDYKEIKEKYGETIAKNIDYNIYELLHNFDRKNGTQLQLDYVNGTLNVPITYDFRKKPNSKNFISKRDKRKVKDIASYQKHVRNVKVSRINQLKVAAVFVGATIIASIPSLNSKLAKSNVNTTEQVVNEITTEATEEAKIPIKTEESTETSVPVVVPINEIMVSEQPEEEVKEESNEAYDILLDNNIELSPEVVLTYDSYGSGPSVEVDNLNCSHFKISNIAVMQDGIFKEYFPIKGNETMSLKEIKEREEKTLGGNISLQVNFNGYIDEDTIIYHNIGYCNADNIKIKSNKKTYQ